MNEQWDRFCKQNTDFQSHSVWCETRDQYACVMGDISQRRNWHNLGARSRRFVCEIAICFTALASFLPHDLRVEWSSILSPDRKWPSPTPENERVGCVAWQWLLHFHGEGLSTNVRPSWGLLASLLPRGTVIKDTRLVKTSLVIVPGRFGRQVFHSSSACRCCEKEGKTSMSSNIRPRVFQPLIDINAVPCRHLPPSDALVIVGVLSWWRRRSLCRCCFSSNPCAPRQISKVAWRCWALLSTRVFRCKGVTLCCFVTVLQIAATMI